MDRDHNSAGQPNWTNFSFAHRVRDKEVPNHNSAGQPNHKTPDADWDGNEVVGLRMSNSPAGFMEYKENRICLKKAKKNARRKLGVRA